MVFSIGACGEQTASEEAAPSSADTVQSRNQVSAGSTGLVLRQPTPAESAQALKALANYMACEECVAGELDTLTVWGDVMVPNLRAILERGASNVQVAAYREYLQESYQRMAAYQDTLPMTEPEMDSASSFL